MGGRPRFIRIRIVAADHVEGGQLRRRGVNFSRRQQGKAVQFHVAVPSSVAQDRRNCHSRLTKDVQLGAATVGGQGKDIVGEDVWSDAGRAQDFAWRLENRLCEQSRRSLGRWPVRSALDCERTSRLTSVGEPMPSELVVYFAVPSAVFTLILAPSVSTQNAYLPMIALLALAGCIGFWSRFTHLTESAFEPPTMDKSHPQAAGSG